MGINIGLDIGGISLKLAAIGKPEDRAALESALRGQAAFRLIGLGCTGRQAIARWSFPNTAASAAAPSNPLTICCRRFYDVVPETQVEGMRVTGSGSRTIAKMLGLFFENEFKAIARMMATFYPAGAHGVRDRRRKLEVHPAGTAARPASSSWITTAAANARPAPARSSISRRCACGTRWRRSASVVCDGGLRGAHRGALLGVRQERHDPRAAEGLLAGRDPARAVRRGGAQFQEHHRQGPAGAKRRWR